MISIRRALALLLPLALAVPALATTVTVNTDSARAVLDALQNSSLSHEAALKVAAMPGNQGVIRKANEFKVPANNQNFAEALYTVAHGKPVTDSVQQYFLFETVKSKAPQISALLKQIAANPEAFQKRIERRIALFTPTDADLHLEGYVVAAGDGGGYAFGSTDFYLNIGMVDEFAVTVGVTTHELYHAVQGAFAASRGAVDSPPTGLPAAQQRCVNTAQLFGNVYEEGSAVYVEDISLLQNASSAIGQRKQEDMMDGIKHVRTSASLLEMSVTALNAPDAMPYDEVYGVGFYGHGILYNVGYIMAKAIAEQDGPQGFAAYLKLPPERFILRYVELPLYGKDKDHPVLGPNTIAAAKSLAGCKPSGSGTR